MLFRSLEINAAAVTAAIPGDYDRNGMVNANDYLTWRSHFGETVAPFDLADGNGDGSVNVADYVVWRDASSGGGAGLSTESESVPEPCGILLAILALFVHGGVRRREASGANA